MKVLLAEDQAYKARLIEEAMSEAFAGVQVTVASSYRSCVDALEVGGWSVMLLDMAMPAFDTTTTEYGGRHDPFAGREVMQEMAWEGHRVPVVVVTQYTRFEDGSGVVSLKEIRAELSDRFPECFFGLVQWDSSTSGWKKELVAAVNRALRGERDDSRVDRRRRRS